MENLANIFQKSQMPGGLTGKRGEGGGGDGMGVFGIDRYITYIDIGIGSVRAVQVIYWVQIITKINHS